VLVATTQEHDHGVADTPEIDVVAWAIVDPHLAYAFADRSDVARVAFSQPIHAVGDPGSGSRIAQAAKLCVWRIVIMAFVHFRRQLVKQRGLSARSAATVAAAPVRT
jgi:hypothetical protein